MFFSQVTDKRNESTSAQPLHSSRSNRNLWRILTSSSYVCRQHFYTMETLLFCYFSHIDTVNVKYFAWFVKIRTAKIWTKQNIEPNERLNQAKSWTKRIFSVRERLVLASVWQLLCMIRVYSLLVQNFYSFCKLTILQCLSQSSSSKTCKSPVIHTSEYIGVLKYTGFFLKLRSL